MVYINGETSRWVYFRGIQKSHANYSEQHDNDIRQHIDYSQQQTAGNYSVQHAEYSEQCVHFAEQQAL